MPLTRMSEIIIFNFKLYFSFWQEYAWMSRKQAVSVIIDCCSYNFCTLHEFSQEFKCAFNLILNPRNKSFHINFTLHLNWQHTDYHKTGKLGSLTFSTYYVMVDGMGIMYGTPVSKFYFKHHSEGIQERGGTAHTAPNIPTPGTKQI